jgi:nitrogen permease regulator 3-like protein
MKSLYESIKSRSLTHLTIHNLLMELQLPPHLDTLFHNTDDEEFAEHGEMVVGSRDGIGTWSRDFSVGAWRPPALEPWRSLLLLSGPDGSGRECVDVYAAIRGTKLREEDKLLAEQLIKFLETVDVTLSYVLFIPFACSVAYYLWDIASRTWRVFWTGTSRHKCTL